MAHESSIGWVLEIYNLKSAKNLWSCAWTIVESPLTIECCCRCCYEQIISLLLGTGVGAGFAVTFELKKQIPDFLTLLTLLGAQGMDEVKSKLDKFFDRANIAIGILFLAFLCMVILSILSSINKAHNSRGLFG